MPTRYLKQGICDSESIDGCSPLAETLFYRLLVNVDDFGRMDARPPVIRAKCFPLKAISIDQIKGLLKELQKSCLIIPYKSDGKEYLQMNKWDNIPRAKTSKCPSPTDECIQMYTDVKQLHTNPPVTETETETETDISSSDDDVFLEFWKIYPRKKAKGEAKKAWKKIKEKRSTLHLIKVALEWQKKTEDWIKDNGSYIPYPSTYLNGERWTDEPTPSTNGSGAYINPHSIKLPNGKVIDDWRVDDEGIKAKGRELNIKLEKDEDIKLYRKRIFDKLGVAYG